MERASAIDKLSVLAKHEFFRGLPPSVIQILAVHARTVEFSAGERIFSKGEEGLGLLAVLRGTVRISTQSPDGREIGLNLLGPNDVFGEIALLDRGFRTADATAVIKSSIIVLDRRDFLPVIEKEPKIAVRLLGILARRLRVTSEQVEDLRFESTKLRLAKALVRLAEVQGVATLDKPRILITQKALGQTVGLTRESINKHLQGWKKAGLITLEKGCCTLLQPDRIRRFAGAKSHSEDQ